MQLFTGKQYLEMDIAAKYGLDKENWNTRLDWFNDNKNHLDKLVEHADEPAGFLAGIMAYRKAKSGQETGYTISLDASASGIQILSVLVGCEKSARTCNVVNTGNREDAYTSIYKAMTASLGASEVIIRNDVKKAVMTSIYGSKAIPEKVFGQGSKELSQFYSTVEEELPGVWALNEELLNLANPNALKYVVEMPDGFVMHLKVMGKVENIVHFNGAPYSIIQNVNKAKDRDIQLGANITHSVDAFVVREMERRCNYSLSQLNKVKNITFGGYSTKRKNDLMLLKLLRLYSQTNFMSARILSVIDNDNAGHLNVAHYKEISALIKGMEHKPFQLLTIHDCFRCLPNYGNYLRFHYVEIMAQIARSNMLSHIASQVTGKPIVVKKLGDISSMVLNSEYMIS